jgi:membrane protein DedA with SNARE-associated domain
VKELLTEHGHLAYLIVLVWTFFEGETIVLIAGGLAQGGYFHPELIAIAAWLGSMAGDQTWFQLGRRFGRPWLAKRPHWAARTARISRLLERNATLFILSFRFFYGLRNISPIVIAVSGISVWRFTILNFIAAGIWAHVFTYGGYFFGKAVMRMVEHLHYASLGIVVVAICLGYYFYQRQRKRRRAEEAAEAAAEAQRIGDKTKH